MPCLEREEAKPAQEAHKVDRRHDLSRFTGFLNGNATGYFQLRHSQKSSKCQATKSSLWGHEVEADVSPSNM